MKNKLLLVLTLMVCVFVSACSCNKFDIDTYESAVKNYKNSIGVDYNLVITKVTEGSNRVISIESTNVYEFEFSPNKVVKNFASTTKTYVTMTSSVAANGDPEKVDEYSRYYVGSAGLFHTYIPSINGNQSENKSYEEKYNSTSEYHIDNMIPAFYEKNISDFNIEADKGSKGYSIATFKAPSPSYLISDDEIIEYKVTINKDSYFSKIEYTVVEGTTTSTYVYSFNKYNNDVKVDFPSYVLGLEGYKITRAAVVNGSITIANSAKAGDFVQVVAKPDLGHGLVVMYYTLDSDPEEMFFFGETGFVMPEGNITIYVMFDKAYLISTFPTNGSITVVGKEVADAIVDVGVQPNAGYKLTELYYIEAGSTEKVYIEKDISGYNFYMPENEIKIYAIFELIGAN